MIPVVAPPLVEPPVRLRRFRAHRQPEGRAKLPGQLTHLTEEPSGDDRPPSSWLSRRSRERRRAPRRAAPAVLMCLSAAVALAAAMVRRKQAGAST